MSARHDTNAASYFEVLNVTTDSNDEDIKQAYRRMAIKFHPDRNPQNRKLSEHRFQLITEAYANIKTQKQRSAYLQHLQNAHKEKAANQNKSFLSQITGFLKKNNSEKQVRKIS
ncbi:DnaJ domain-containing protein [Alphaproteobacteria bacterium]|nr:DnaJ domain-containing protein [Alphaproteobacteria bacterium]